MSRRPTSLPLAERVKLLGYRDLDEAPGSLLLSVVETSAYLGVATSTLDDWRSSGRGPRCVRVGDSRLVGYTLHDLREWLAGGAR